MQLMAQQTKLRSFRTCVAIVICTARETESESERTSGKILRFASTGLPRQYVLLKHRFSARKEALLVLLQSYLVHLSIYLQGFKRGWSVREVRSFFFGFLASGVDFFQLSDHLHILFYHT